MWDLEFSQPETQDFQLNGIDEQRVLPPVVVVGQAFNPDYYYTGQMPQYSTGEIQLPGFDSSGISEDGGNEDDPCGNLTEEERADMQLTNLADHVRDMINGFDDSYRYEFGSILVEGEFGPELFLGAIQTEYDNGQIEFTVPSDASGVLAIIHNHPDQGYSSVEDLLNRYPSDNDWQAAEDLVAMGADPDKLSLFIIDKDGVMREYKYSDKSDLSHYQKTTSAMVPTSLKKLSMMMRKE